MVQQAHAAKTTNQAADVDNHTFEKGCHFSPSIAPQERSIEAPGSASPKPIDPSQHANIHAAKMTNQAADVDDQASEKGSFFSPSIAPREPSIEAPNSASPKPIDPSQHANIPLVASNRLFVGKRMIRTVVGGVLIAIVVAVAAYRDNQTRKLLKTWGHSSVIWLSSALSVSERVQNSAAEPSAKLPDQTSAPAVTSRLANEVAELQQQLQTVVNDLTVLRRNVEQLSSMHEQMSRDIATVQATEQNVSEKISSLTQPAPVHAPPRKKVPRFVHAETPRQQAAASVPPQTSANGTASPTEQPPRPPLPVPTPAETPSPLH
jgi:hypothetical protein